MPLDRDNPLDLADPSWGEVEPTILSDTEQLFDRLDFFLKKVSHPKVNTQTATVHSICTVLFNAAAARF